MIGSGGAGNCFNGRTRAGNIQPDDGFYTRAIICYGTERAGTIDSVLKKHVSLRSSTTIRISPHLVCKISCICCSIIKTNFNGKIAAAIPVKGFLMKNCSSLLLSKQMRLSKLLSFRRSPSQFHLPGWQGWYVPFLL